MVSLVDMTDALKLDLEERRADSEPSSDIFLVRGTTGRDGGFSALLGLMGENGLKFYQSHAEGDKAGPDGLISPDSVVIVKVNSQWDERGGTNTDLVKAIVESITAHPEGFTGEVVIADNGQAQYGSTHHGGSLDYEKNNAEDKNQSNRLVAQSFTEHRVSIYLWDAITSNQVGEYCEGDMEDGYVIEDIKDPTGIRVSYPKFTTEQGTHISFKLGVWDPEKGSYDSERLKLINVPVLKAHFIYGVTACVKHYMGVVSDKLQGGSAHRSVGTGGMGAEIAGTRMPTLNVLDAIWVNSTPGKGPRCSYEEATRLNLVMAGTDPIALDHWATANILMQAARIQGHSDLSKFDPENPEPDSHGVWLRLSTDTLRESGHPVICDEERMNIYITDA
ncbi:MAG: DUF362 domain-containing protein [Candidatus Bathyarchaeota archaeon]|jgi:hypothetical protein